MSNLSDNDVNEATAALKGMLGIGSGSAGPTPSKSAGGKPKGAKQGRKGIKRLQSVAANKTIEVKATPGGGSNTKAQQNFAWSAFQASPDASALPIPAFVSPVNSATGDESSTQLDPSQLISCSRSGDQQLNPVPLKSSMLLGPKILRHSRLQKPKRRKELLLKWNRNLMPTPRTNKHCRRKPNQ
ncbi:hypothetical protein MHU86_15338 [Fragilaria crotonensis]|nr:hypothetical protein MHU86_15338 [Fragilaria crotonensis]